MDEAIKLKILASRALPGTAVPLHHAPGDERATHRAYPGCRLFTGIHSGGDLTTPEKRPDWTSKFGGLIAGNSSGLGAGEIALCGL